MHQPVAEVPRSAPPPTPPLAVRLLVNGLRLMAVALLIWLLVICVSIAL